jgi:hypothetical protein
MRLARLRASFKHDRQCGDGTSEHGCGRNPSRPEHVRFYPIAPAFQRLAVLRACHDRNGRAVMTLRSVPIGKTMTIDENPAADVRWASVSRQLRLFFVAVAVNFVWEMTRRSSSRLSLRSSAETLPRSL